MPTTYGYGHEGVLSFSRKVFGDLDGEDIPLRTTYNAEYLGESVESKEALSNKIAYIVNTSYSVEAGIFLLTARYGNKEQGGRIDVYCQEDAGDRRVFSHPLLSIEYGADTAYVPDDARTTEFADKYMRGIKPKKYGMTSEGKISAAGAVKWLYHGLLKNRTSMEESDLKDILTELQDKKYYLYALKDGFPEVACTIASATKTTSCMTKSSVLEAYRQFNYVRTNFLGERVWLHPFRGYEHENNRMLAVSLLPPEKVFDKTHNKIPFIARGFCYDGKCARWYGSGERNWWDMFSDEVEYATPLGMPIYAYYVNNSQQVLPYVDGADDVTDQYLNSVEYRCTVNKQHSPANITAWMMRICDREHNNDKDRCGYWYTGVATATMMWEDKEERHTCAVTGEDYTEDEMMYSEDIDEWVRSDFTRYDESRGMRVLDGARVLEYFR